MLKKIIALAVAGMLVLCCACPAEELESTPPQEAPAPVETQAPAETQAPTETEAPAETQAPAETEAPAETQAPAETETPAESASPAPTVNPECQAWFEAEDGQLVWGDLKDVLPLARKDATIYLREEVDQVLFVPDFTEETARDFKFLPDPDKYDPKRYEVLTACEAPEGVEAPDLEHDYLYVWVHEIPLAPTPQPGQPEIEISVDAPDYQPGKWSCVEPVFTLSGIPEGDERYVYAVVIYDERFVILSGDTYTARDEGVSDIRFAILDGLGDVVSMSAPYNLMLDYTAPTGLAAAAVEGSYTDYTVFAEDALSGVEAYSADGGVTWVSPNEEGLAAFSAAKSATIPAGQIQARDAAGNIAILEEDFMLPQKEPGGGGGGGGGDGEKKPTHAPIGENLDLNPYNALDLELSTQPQTELTMGETVLPMTLSLVEAEDFTPDTDYQPTFLPSLDRWNAAADETADASDAQTPARAPDTLLLTVSDDAQITGEYAYAFTFNGIVYRMLQNSGVDYVMLRVGDHCVAFSTAGFTAGTEYTRLKAAGVSTKKFEYVVTLRGNKADDADFQVEMRLSVDTDEEVLEYPLTEDTMQEMYYYDVQIGAPEMMRQAFGAYAPDEISD